jgi:ribosomal-protein-alanine N-acetyltransferase
VIVEIVVRGYRREDLDAMYALDVACFEPVFRFSKRAMRSFAEVSGALVAVAESDGELVGFAIVQIEAGSRGYVVTLDVAEAWRRQGLARRLMEELEAKADAAGATEMELHVYSGNKRAMRLYEGLGYARIGLAENFYARGTDAWVYWKRLAK